MALRGLLYCAAILIQTILVDSNVEIRFGAEKSMVRSDCRVVFFHRFRSGERYLSAALEAPHGLPCGSTTGKCYTICVFPLTLFTFCDIIDL